jgi:hypothetical protein
MLFRLWNPDTAMKAHEAGRELLNCVPEYLLRQIDTETYDAKPPDPAELAAFYKVAGREIRRGKRKWIGRDTDELTDQLPNCDPDETWTDADYFDYYVGLILAYLRHRAAGRKALAALATDLAIESNDSVDELEQVDDQPPQVDAAILSLSAAPAAPPRLLTAA